MPETSKVIDSSIPSAERLQFTKEYERNVGKNKGCDTDGCTECCLEMNKRG
jgi:hypothetical protein